MPAGRPRNAIAYAGGPVVHHGGHAARSGLHHIRLFVSGAALFFSIARLAVVLTPWRPGRVAPGCAPSRSAQPRGPASACWPVAGRRRRRCSRRGAARRRGAGPTTGSAKNSMAPAPSGTGSACDFRSGRVVPAPAGSSPACRPEPLDGELWLGRGRFADCPASCAASSPRTTNGGRCASWCSNSPARRAASPSGSPVCRPSWPAGVPWLQVVEQFRVADRAALQARLDAVVAAAARPDAICTGPTRLSHRAQRRAPQAQAAARRRATVVAICPGVGGWPG